MATVPRCSVVIPAFNAERYVAEAVRSALSQSVGDLEVTVVNDGSTDETGAIVAAIRDDRLRVVQQENRGVSAARNRGLAGASAPFVVFLDADDRLRHDAVQRLMGAFGDHSDAIAAYGEAIAMDAEGRVFGPDRAAVFHRRPHGDVLPSLLEYNFVATPGVLCARTEAVRGAGGFPEDLRVSEDWVLWCRLAARGSFAYVGEEPVVEYRHAPSSATRSVGVDLSLTMASIDAAFNDPTIVGEVGAERLASLRRKREGQAFAFVGTQELRARRWRAARLAFRAALRKRPFRVREWVLFFCAAGRILPSFVERKLK